MRKLVTIEEAARVLIMVFKKLFDTGRTKHKEAIFAVNPTYGLYKPTLFFRNIFSHCRTNQVLAVYLINQFVWDDNDLPFPTCEAKHLHLAANPAVRRINVLRREEKWR